MLAFDGVLNFPVAIPDGTTNTVAFAERYYFCPKAPYGLNDWTYLYGADAREAIHGGTRRASFADKGWLDVLPVTDPATGQTVASARGTTFQFRPPILEANSKQLQTPHPAGLPVAMFDGSVRTVSPRVDESVFWRSITPAGGEVGGLD